MSGFVFIRDKIGGTPQVDTWNLQQSPLHKKQAATNLLNLQARLPAKFAHWPFSRKCKHNQGIAKCIDSIASIAPNAESSVPER